MIRGATGHQLFPILINDTVQRRREELNAAREAAQNKGDPQPETETGPPASDDVSESETGPNTQTKPETETVGTIDENIRTENADTVLANGNNGNTLTAGFSFGDLDLPTILIGILLVYVISRMV